MKVESVHVYPVKATAPTSLAAAQVEFGGLRGDRRWMVIDEAGDWVTASRSDALLGVTAELGDRRLRLTAEGRPEITVDEPVAGRVVPVAISRLETAVDAGDTAAEWFSAIVGEPVRLVWQDDPAKREVGEKHGGHPDDRVSLADVAPLLLTTTASLDQLNRWIAEDHEPETVVMRQFRPNVVVDGDIAFAEDDWRNIRIGDVAYRFAEHCDRCVVTTIDPQTLHHSKEPIRSMARHRKWDGKTWFGIRIIPLSTGTLSVGDTVIVE
ncbi:MOSC domain-containing protein [Aeromicrobium panaciterrae]|uniref:MOSC domain-containing protein n=1 Tax=Aeromicrobium panaciterrae TaxID=363861 RepID=UPI0031DCB7EF